LGICFGEHPDTQHHSGPVKISPYRLDVLAPENGVIGVAAPYVFGRPSLVRELRVKDGDRVRAGQPLAILDGNDQLQAALDQCRARVAVARSRLAQVKAGPRTRTSKLHISSNTYTCLSPGAMMTWPVIQRASSLAEKPRLQRCRSVERCFREEFPCSAVREMLLH
jgi:multidrug efflux pump subunit AcrA (membrane-fusion protein)